MPRPDDDFEFKLAPADAAAFRHRLARSGGAAPRPVQVRPLTPHERTWLARLEKVLQEMPKRLLLLESGDGLMLVDRHAAKQAELHDGKAREAGIVLADVIHGTFKVKGVSG